jgi:hypothetical protein
VTSVKKKGVLVIVVLENDSKMSQRMLSIDVECMYRFRVVYKVSKRWQNKAPVIRQFTRKIQYYTQQINSADRADCTICKKLVEAVFKSYAFGTVDVCEFSSGMKIGQLYNNECFTKVMQYQYIFCTSSYGTHFVAIFF